MPHETDLDTPVTELPEGVNREVFEKLETAFGDDWKYFPVEEQKRICEVVESIPPVVKSQRRAFTQEMLQNLVQVHGLIVMRGINTEPLAMLTNFAGIAAIRGSIEKFNANEANVKKVRLLTKREASLLAEVERRLPDHTKITGKRTNDELRQLMPLAVAWIRLKKKAGFANIVGKDERDAANMPNYRTTGPDEDNRGTAVLDLLPEDLQAILHPPVKTDVVMREVQSDINSTLNGSTGDDGGPEGTDVIFKHRGEKVDEPNDVPKQPVEFRPETLVQRAARFAQRNAEPASEPENVQPESSGEVATISDANRALIEEILKVSPRFAAILESIPAGEENSAKARSAESMIHVFETIAQRIAGNAQPSKNSGRQPLVLGNDVIQLDDNTLERIEAGKLVFRVRTHEIVIEKVRTEEAAAEVAGAKQ